MWQSIHIKEEIVINTNDLDGDTLNHTRYQDNIYHSFGVKFHRVVGPTNFMNNKAFSLNALKIYCSHS